MPTYQYQCANGHQFERRQRMSDRPIHKCPECGASAQRQISGGTGLIFKGSGFYITDYGKDGKGPRPTGTPSSAEPAPAPAIKSSPPAPSTGAGGGGSTPSSGESG